MRSPTKTFFVMLLLTVVAAGLAGWAGVQVGLGKAAGEADLDTVIHRDLQLTQQQEERIRLLEQEFSTQRDALQAEMRAANRELATAIIKEHAYTPNAHRAGRLGKLPIFVGHFTISVPLLHFGVLNFKQQLHTDIPGQIEMAKAGFSELGCGENFGDHVGPPKQNVGVCPTKVQSRRRLLADGLDQETCIRRYTDVFGQTLRNDNRMCLAGIMAAGHEELPDKIKTEVVKFGHMNVDWIARVLLLSKNIEAEVVQRRALAIFSAVQGAQLVARSRGDVAIYDAIVETYRMSVLLP
jgi:hypothetical protein